uniref:hypothetical protein n=1 Tax=Rhodococcus aetherivorans TaxID=191292 RepID=UPI001867EA04|nr:hypothetical protein [Rhodococcus aetherivorans]
MLENHDDNAIHVDPEHPNEHVDHFAQRNPQYAAYLETLAARNHARVAHNHEIDSVRKRLRAAGILD